MKNFLTIIALFAMLPFISAQNKSVAIVKPLDNK